MIKYIVSNPKRYLKHTTMPVFNKYVFFNLQYLDTIKDENLFFKAIHQVRLANGIYKTTKAKRFVDIDTQLTALLKPGVIYKIHDVAASDGITSVDLYNTLKAAGINLELHMSDKFSVIYCEKKWYGALYKDADAAVLYADFFSIQASRYIISRRYILSRLLGFLFPQKSPLKPTDKEVHMLNPKTRSLINEGKISFSYYDIFEVHANAEEYDVVRCMNVLNHNVFADETIVQGALNLVSTIKENGFFIIGRTEENTGQNRVTIFRKKQNELELVININDGSEVKNLLINGKR
ncbi:MAG TPA: hypothetical protein PKC39_01630 [Ferruginibacter sp.]|nr:hypothetical protein [Ferruginibacter sp.]HMP19635.1 hypothetical protein [Ferruginibacter sp.]